MAKLSSVTALDLARELARVEDAGITVHHSRLEDLESFLQKIEQKTLANRQTFVVRSAARNFYDKIKKLQI